MTSGEIEPTQNNKTVFCEPPSTFSSLPDEITENILARVSRWNYPSLSLVSKRFHSLLSSMDIYKTRSQIGAEETCVYVLLELHDQPRASWFSLRTKPNNQNRTKRRGKIRFKRDPSGFLVVPIPSSSDASPELHNITTVGPEIYISGGPYKEPTTSVQILDCRSHTWRDSPNMTVAREDPDTVLLDEKIYVMGGRNIDEYTANWIEVFDIKSQSWSALRGPGADDDDELRNYLYRNKGYYYVVNAFEGKIYVATDKKEYSYEPKNGTWKLVKENSSLICVSCTIGNVIYGCTGSKHLMWSSRFENEGREWREIKGLEKLREHPTIGLKTGSEFGLVGCGGQLLVMWDRYRPYPCSPFKRSNKIWYAKISLESRCSGREVWGKVECVDVLTFPVESYACLVCVAASV